MFKEKPSCISYMTVIAGRKQKDVLAEALSEAGGRLITVMYGKGSIKSDYLHDMFGLVPEENKVIISCLLHCQKVDAVMEMLATRFHFEKPNTGIAFTISVENTSL